jgi:hypothetical protein
MDELEEIARISYFDLRNSRSHDKGKPPATEGRKVPGLATDG